MHTAENSKYTKTHEWAHLDGDIATVGISEHAQSEIGDVVFNVRGESNPCSLCAKLRKGAFNDKAKELGCNKSAYAHHKDDVIETMLLSLLYEGRFNCFSPVTYLDRMDITLIRPLIYVTEADIIGFQHKYNLPVQKNPCPADGYTIFFMVRH